MGGSRPLRFQGSALKWRFLSDASEHPISQPHATETRKRIEYLEQALESTNDIDAQYQAFLKEMDVAKRNTSSALKEFELDWNNTRSLLHPSAVKAVLPSDSPGSDDTIPSDPVESPGRSFRTGRRGRRKGVGETFAGAAHAAEDAEVARVQASRPVCARVSFHSHYPASAPAPLTVPAKSCARRPSRASR